MLELFGSPVLGTVLIVVIALALIVVLIMTTWRKIPNDHAAVIVGTGKPKVVTGGGVMVIPLLQRMDMITLETIGLNVKVCGVKTSLGVPINAEGYIIIKVKSDENSILTAMQMFYCNNEGKTKDKITDQTQRLCEGKLREIVSGLTVEEIYDNRDKFSASVMDVASSALSEIGIELKSFTINDITDDDQYIESLGKAQISKVKADAAIAQAEAAKEEAIKTAEADKLGRQAQISAQTQVAESEKEKNMKLLAYKKEQDGFKAEADAAYKIQENVTKKQVTDTEMDAEVIRQNRSREVTEAEIQVKIAAEQKGIELAQRQAERKEADLIASVIKPAEAERKRMELEAEAEKIKSIKRAEAESESKKLYAAAQAEAKKLDAEAEASKIKQQGEAEASVISKTGEAEAEAIRLKGLAEAEALNKKAEALAKMNEAGKLQMVMEVLPEIARAVSEPMSKIGNISIIGGGSDGSGGDASDVARSAVGALKAVTEAVKETVGFDITKVMEAKTIDAMIKRDVTLTTPEGGIDVQVRDMTKVKDTEKPDSKDKK